MKISFRQGIVSHQIDNYGHAQFLQVTPTGVSLIATPVPTLIAFAHGHGNNYLFKEHQTIRNAWIIPRNSTVTHWLYWDLDARTGVRTFGSTVVEPQIGSIPPANPVPDLIWFNLKAATMHCFKQGCWTPVIRVFACKLEPGGHITGMAGEGNPLTTFTGSQVGLTDPIKIGALIYDKTGLPLKGADGKFFTTEDTFTTGISTTAGVKLEFIINEAFAQENIPACSAVVYNDFDKVQLADKNSSASRVVGIVEEDSRVGTLVRVITNGIVSNQRWEWPGVNLLVYANDNGVISTDKAYATQIPIGITISPKSILMKIPFTQFGANPGEKGEKGEPGGPTRLNELTDIDDSTAPVNNDQLIYNAGAGKWIPSPVVSIQKYVHVQSTQSTTWWIQHEKNNENFTYVLKDANGKQFFPDEMQVVDADNIVVQLLQPTSGSITLLFT